MRPLVIALGLAIARASASVSAQSASEVGAARALFEQGVAAAREARWEDALAAFERSYAIAPRASTRLNLAGAQVQLGRLVAAAESYRATIADAGSGARDRRIRDQATEALAALEPRLAHVTIEIAALRDGDVVRVDHEEVASAILGVATPMNPGAHEIEVERAGAIVGRRHVELAEGERATVAVALAMSADTLERAPVADVGAGPGARAPSEPGDAGGGDAVFASPGRWAVIGGGGGGGGGSGVVVATLPSEPTYYSGSLGDGQIRF